MNRESLYFWERALKAHKTAIHDLELDPDAAASRAYYSAFYAVSALFALDGMTFSSHAAVEIAVHKHLIKTGKWPVGMGKIYSSLRESRMVGDYGGVQHVLKEGAQNAIDSADIIIQSVQKERPDIFSI